MRFAEWLSLARPQFPLLNEANCRPTSPADEGYNCVAWAAGDSQRWWWPDRQRQQYWPEVVERAETLEAFVRTLGLLGYSQPTNGLLELGRQKIALFASDHGAPTHAARQLPDGWWTSKLGQHIDIEHELAAIEGPAYGKVAFVLARVV